MKNLVIFSMVMLILASGYMYGIKLVDDMNINQIPTLDDIRFDKLGVQESGKGTSDAVGSPNNSLNDVLDDIKEFGGSMYNYINGWLYSIPPTSTNELNNSTKIISKDEAKKIAQRYIEEPGAVAAEPLLVNYNGNLAYVVPVLLNGAAVGEIYIDAQNGQNLGGAGGVNYNEPDNSNDDNSNKIDNWSNSENGITNNESNNAGSDDKAGLSNISGNNGTVKGVEMP